MTVATQRAQKKDSSHMENTILTFTHPVGAFRNAIRSYRAYKKEWQERINKELDEREECLRKAKAEFQMELA